MLRQFFAARSKLANRLLICIAWHYFADDLRSVMGAILVFATA
jgi:hypothetical protein